MGGSGYRYCERSQAGRLEHRFGEPHAVRMLTLTRNNVGRKKRGAGGVRIRKTLEARACFK